MNKAEKKMKFFLKDLTYGISRERNLFSFKALERKKSLKEKRDLPAIL